MRVRVVWLRPIRGSPQPRSFMNSRWRERVRALLLQCADRRLYLGGQQSRHPGKHYIQSDVIVVDVDRAARDLAEGAHAKPQLILGPHFLPHRQQPRKILLHGRESRFPPNGLRLAQLVRNLLVEGAEDPEEEEALRAEVEVTLIRRGMERPRTITFQTEQTVPCD
jgi:hypothetical protein